MNPELYYHPLASFCHKVLIALYENETAFSAHTVDLMNESEKYDFLDLWPVGKMPVLRDQARNQVVPEATVIIEYLQQHYPGEVSLLPADKDSCLETRLWDRFFDLYVQLPMQTLVTNRIREEAERNPLDISGARATLRSAYQMIERRMERKTWVIGECFTLADCAAAPALFYAGIVEPFPADLENLGAYFERLLARPSFHRVLVEAQPYFELFPYRDEMPERFLSLGKVNA
jgi:glutathione S-transferase